MSKIDVIIVFNNKDTLNIVCIIHYIFVYSKSLI